MVHPRDNSLLQPGRVNSKITSILTTSRSSCKLLRGSILSMAATRGRKDSLENNITLISSFRVQKDNKIRIIRLWFKDYRTIFMTQMVATFSRSRWIVHVLEDSGQLTEHQSLSISSQYNNKSARIIIQMALKVLSQIKISTSIMKTGERDQR